MIYVSTFPDWESVPPVHEPVFQEPGAGLFHTRPWLTAFARHGVAPGDRFRLYGITWEHGSLALLPAVVSRLYVAHPRARVLHFIQPEGDPYAPLFPPDSQDLLSVCYGLIECIRAEQPPCDVIRISPLDPNSPFAIEILSNLRRRRFPVQVYRHLDDRYEVTEGSSSYEYLSARPRELHERLRAQGQSFFGRKRGQFRLISDPAEVDAASEAYQSVVEANPDQVEIESEHYVENLMRVAAEADALRFGSIVVDGKPAAVQLWIVSAGVARCLRIWSDPVCAALPLDDMLSERLMPQLLDVDRVRELDFGPIDDAFARNWAPRRRERSGVIAFNPRTWRGIKGAARHILLPKMLAGPRRLRRKLLGRPT